MQVAPYVPVLYVTFGHDASFYCSQLDFTALVLVTQRAHLSSVCVCMSTKAYEAQIVCEINFVTLRCVCVTHSGFIMCM